MSATKIISLRIPMETYEEILSECIITNRTISEWLQAHLMLVNRLSKNLDDVINDVRACEEINCPFVKKFKGIFEDDKN